MEDVLVHHGKVVVFRCKHGKDIKGTVTSFSASIFDFNYLGNSFKKCDINGGVLKVEIDGCWIINCSSLVESSVTGVVQPCVLLSSRTTQSCAEDTHYHLYQLTDLKYLEDVVTVPHMKIMAKDCTSKIILEYICFGPSLVVIDTLNKRISAFLNLHAKICSSSAFVHEMNDSVFGFWSTSNNSDLICSFITQKEKRTIYSPSKVLKSSNVWMKVHITFSFSEKQAVVSYEDFNQIPKVYCPSATKIVNIDESGN